MYVEGRVLTTEGKPIEGAIIDTWEADSNGMTAIGTFLSCTPYSPSPGFYDTQYADRTRADCRGRVHTGKDGSFGYRAIVPPAYPIPGDVSVPLGVLIRREF